MDGPGRGKVGDGGGGPGGGGGQIDLENSDKATRKEHLPTYMYYVPYDSAIMENVMFHKKS